MKTTPRQRENARKWRDANPEYMRLASVARKEGRKFSVKDYRATAYDKRPNAGVGRRKGGGVFNERLVRELQAFQNHICGICPRNLNCGEQSRLGHSAADHCKINLAPRGILCWACNIALGWYESQQKPAGLSIQAYDDYLANPPFRRSGLVAPPPIKKRGAEQPRLDSPV